MLRLRTRGPLLRCKLVMANRAAHSLLWYTGQTNVKILLRGPCSEGGESETRQSAHFLMDLVFQWLLSSSLKQGFY